MQKWEYCLVMTTPKEVLVRKPGESLERFEAGEGDPEIGILGRLGTEGWEAVGFDVAPTADLFYLFKRPIQE